MCSSDLVFVGHRSVEGPRPESRGPGRPFFVKSLAAGQIFFRIFSGAGSMVSKAVFRVVFGEQVWEKSVEQFLRNFNFPVFGGHRSVEGPRSGSQGPGRPIFRKSLATGQIIFS